MGNDPLQRLRIARNLSESAYFRAMQSQEQYGPDLQSDGLVGVLRTLLDIVNEELPKLDRLLSPSHD